jgi:hypothetical protein
MAGITLDTSHALSRPDQHRNRQQLSLISTCGFRPLIVSPETGERSSRKKYGWPARNTQKMLTLFSRQARPPYGGTSPCRRGDRTLGVRARSKAMRGHIALQLRKSSRVRRCAREILRSRSLYDLYGQLERSPWRLFNALARLCGGVAA